MTSGVNTNVVTIPPRPWRHDTTVEVRCDDGRVIQFPGAEAGADGDSGMLIIFERGRPEKLFALFAPGAWDYVLNLPPTAAEPAGEPNG